MPGEGVPMFKKIVFGAVVMFLLNVFCLAEHEEGALWPESQPYQTGYLKVSDIHEIFYQLGGNPKGQPVMVLHGGPGGGCSTQDFRFFNPEKFQVILHDQRGASRSKPYAELRQNSTWDLVKDIEKLRRHFNLGQVILFGGSWGSTLALAYAETYPQHVAGMVLRGVFAATREELDYYYNGGTAKFFPEIYEELCAVASGPAAESIASRLVKKLQSPDRAVRERTARAWARYEGKIAFLEMPDSRLDKALNRWSLYGFSLIENYYLAQRCFLKEGQLLDNADKLVGIPLVIVNGRYDVICPPITAYRLHKKLPGSKLVIVERAGHSASEPGITAELVKAMRDFEK